MQGVSERQPGTWVAALRGFLDVEPTPVKRCELCSAEIEPAHAHLIELATRRILCACQACVMLFDSPQARHYRRIPRDTTRLREFALTDAQWDAFRIPINLAFFFHSAAEDRVVAMYPGPAGATESTLDLEAWNDLLAANPELADMEADVEALLVNRVEGRREYYRAPIDRCFELVGRIRRRWHGLSGGDGVREAITAFFAELDR